VRNAPSAFDFPPPGKKRSKKHFICFLLLHFFRLSK
jgi:hypothetical protein